MIGNRVLQLQKISKKYGQQQAVSMIDFSLEKGEIVGFLGPNGAGKTTTMKIITGCLAPDSGDVVIGGHSIIREPIEARSLIGYLPEHNSLYDEMYVHEYLSYAARIYLPGDVKSKVNDMIDAVGLRPESRKKIGQLSKGYRQRVGLAQAFIHDPQLLILDEPITGLDPNQIEEMERFLKNKSADKAILFSSHTLSEVSSLCTRVIIIHQGRMVLDQPINEIDNLESTFKELTRK